MKRTHKGFTLVELLIVIAVIATLAVMMTMSSTDAVDSARANTIISNLTSLKTAAYQLYMYEDVGMVSINFDGKIGTETRTSAQIEAGSPDLRSSIATTLSRYLGKESSIITDGNYGLVGDTTNGWYAVYKIDDTDSSGAKAKLAASASKVELLGVSAITTAALKTAATPDTTTKLPAYYDNTASTTQTHVALKVR